MLKDQMSHAEITQEDKKNEKIISDRDRLSYDYGCINRMFRGQEAWQPCCIYHIIRRQRNEKSPVGTYTRAGSGRHKRT